MIYKKLIEILEAGISAIVKKWADQVAGSEYMETYQSLPKDEVAHRGEKLFENLIKWLGDGGSDDELKNYFESVGAARNDQGFPLSEVIFALYLTRKVLWESLFNENGSIDSFDKKEILEMVHVLNNYFDRGNFFITRGYLNELFVKLGESEKFSKDELENLLVKGALYKESVKPAKSQLYDIGFKIGVIANI